ncbi:MAG: hypothetical protein NTW07_12120 [candidate division Zixibacteria bacterium]|nr:hypothetical protein [candidate division Zixibacteria bacterium]
MRKLFIAALAAVAVILAVSPGFAAPLMVIPEIEFDFGYVPQNSEISHVFWIFNRGDDSLKIEKVVPG